MVREFSAGGVVLRKMRGRWFLAVIEPHMERPKKSAKPAAARPKATAALVALPKGAIDEGEKPEQTALREVREETGVRAELVAKLADIKYFYVRNWGDNARVFKIVSFYLLLYRSGRLGRIHGRCGSRSTEPTGWRWMKRPRPSVTKASARWCSALSST